MGLFKNYTGHDKIILVLSLNLFITSSNLVESKTYIIIYRYDYFLNTKLLKTRDVITQQPNKAYVVHS